MKRNEYEKLFTANRTKANGTNAGTTIPYNISPFNADGSWKFRYLIFVYQYYGLQTKIVPTEYVTKGGRQCLTGFNTYDAASSVTAFLGEIGLTMYDANVKIDHNYNLNVYGSTASARKVSNTSASGADSYIVNILGVY